MNGAPDPFRETADPEVYVPRTASEAALAALERAVVDARPCVVLHGPPGVGKTLLVRVLERRLSGRARFVSVPYGALCADDLFRWVLGVMEGGSGRGAVSLEDPERALLDAARRLAALGTPLVVVIDDASSLAPGDARALVRLATASEGTLRLLVVPIDDDRAGELIAALGAEVVDVRYSEALTGVETAALLDARLSGTGAEPDVRAMFGPNAVDYLHANAQGNPRRVLQLAGEILRRGGLERTDDEIEAESMSEAVEAALAEGPEDDFERADGEEAGREEQDAVQQDAAEPLREASEPVEVSRSPVRIPEPVTPPVSAEPIEAAAERRRRLAIAGLVLFLLALVAGFVWSQMRGPSAPAAQITTQRDARSTAAKVPAPSAPDRADALELPFAEPLQTSPAAMSAPIAPGTMHDTTPEPAEEPAPSPVAVVAPAEPTAAEESSPAEPAGVEEPSLENSRPTAEPAVAERPEPPPLEPLAADVAEPAAAAPALPPIGVNINATPWARIEVDGADLGYTPLADVPLAPGEHSFRAEFGDGSILERAESVSESHRHLSFSLTP